MNTNLNSIKLPSKAQIGDDVDIVFDETKSLKGCTVHGITFLSGEVDYDVMVPIGFGNNYAGLIRVSSSFVFTLQDSPLNKEKTHEIKLPTDNELDEYSNELADNLDLDEKQTELAATHIHSGMLKIREYVRKQL